MPQQPNIHISLILRRQWHYQCGWRPLEVAAQGRAELLEHVQFETSHRCLLAAVSVSECHLLETERK